MQFFIIAAFAAMTAASPIAGASKYGGGNGNTANKGHKHKTGCYGGSSSLAAQPICSGLFTPQCCQTDVLGVVGLTCNSPSLSVNSKKSLVKDCAKTGTTAQCCIIPIIGQGIICTDV